MTTKRFDAGSWLRTNWLELLLLVVLVVAIAWLATVGRDIWQQMQPEPSPTPLPGPTAAPGAFDGPRAAGIVNFLTALGPRVAGSEALAVTTERVEQELREAGWQVEVQPFELEGVSRRNIVAKAGAGEVILVGAHIDSSPRADLDPNEANRQTPAPGANDGGSGAAVLLEAATAGVQALTRQASWTEPLQAVVLLDLLGATRQQFFVDASADPTLSQRLWSLAEQLGLGGWFVQEPGAGIDLGQATFADMGAPTVVIAGSDYLFWRTMQDTPDQIDPESLARVGRLLQAFLENQLPSQ